MKNSIFIYLCLFFNIFRFSNIFYMLLARVALDPWVFFFILRFCQVIYKIIKMFPRWLSFLGFYSLFFILYSLFFILYSLFFILYSLFFILPVFNSHYFLFSFEFFFFSIIQFSFCLHVRSFIDIFRYSIWLILFLVHSLLSLRISFCIIGIEGNDRTVMRRMRRRTRRKRISGNIMNHDFVYENFRTKGEF